jgi:hypothetical protein
MTGRRAALRIEELGSRTLPSTSTSAGLLPAGGVQTVTAPAHGTLAGQGRGTYSVSFAVPDAGAPYNLTGTANLCGLGVVAVKGSVHSVGFALHGHAQGTLTFSNAGGTVTVSLDGPQQAGFAPLPQDFHYRVVGGTGDYRRVAGQGTLRLALNAADPVHGTFTLTVGTGRR